MLHTGQEIQVPGEVRNEYEDFEFEEDPGRDPREVGHDAYEMYNALKGWGTDEEVATAVIQRNIDDIPALYNAFDQVLQRKDDTDDGDLIDWLRDDGEDEMAMQIKKAMIGDAAERVNENIYIRRQKMLKKKDKQLLERWQKIALNRSVLNEQATGYLQEDETDLTVEGPNPDAPDPAAKQVRLAHARKQFAAASKAVKAELAKPNQKAKDIYGLPRGEGTPREIFRHWYTEMKNAKRGKPSVLPPDLKKTIPAGSGAGAAGGEEKKERDPNAPDAGVTGDEAKIDKGMVMSDAQALVDASDGYTGPDDERKISEIVMKHIKAGSVDYLQKMYQRQAKGLDQEDQGTLYDMLRHEGLNKVAQQFRAALRNPKARGGHYVKENKSRIGVTKKQFKKLVKEELRKTRNKKR